MGVSRISRKTENYFRIDNIEDVSGRMGKISTKQRKKDIPDILEEENSIKAKNDKKVNLQF